jgi:glycosyltransferase involved in cell wall biosynthesis
MKSKPLISVIMNCLNGSKYLKYSIKSVLDQEYKNWELIFWDNNSTDKSAEILFSFKDKRIKYFKSNSFAKLYRGRNLAIKKAKGDYITFLDTDDWWFKDKLTKQVLLLKKNKNVKFIYSNFYVYDQTKEKRKLYIKTKLDSGKIAKKLLKKYVVGILTVLIEKKIFKKYKFNEDYNIIGDFDLFTRLSLDYKFYAIQKPLAYYRSHARNYMKHNTQEYVDELKHWIKNYSHHFKKKKIELKYPKLVIKKWQIKNFVQNLF